MSEEASETRSIADVDGEKNDWSEKYAKISANRKKAEEARKAETRKCLDLQRYWKTSLEFVDNSRKLSGNVLLEEMQTNGSMWDVQNLLRPDISGTHESRV